jgi:thiol:disulfide interchange protein DsbA
MGLIEKLHRALFDAIHVDRLRTDNAEALRAWLVKQGADLKRFEDAFKSFGVQSKVRQSQQLTNAYRVEGTPTMAVHGRYTVSPEQGGSHRGIVAVVDHLVALTRKNLAGAR